MYEKDLFEQHYGDDVNTVQEKVARFNQSIAKIEKWLGDNGLPTQPGIVRFCDQTKKYAVSLSIGKNRTLCYKLAPAFWAFVAQHVPLYPQWLADVAKSGWKMPLKKVGDGWLVRIEPCQTHLPGPLPDYEYWRAHHVFRWKGRTTRRNVVPEPRGATLESFL